MTFIEALKTGRPFKRKGWSLYVHEINERLYWDKDEEISASVMGEPSSSIAMSSVLADDWEVQEESLQITELDLHKALVDISNGLSNAVNMEAIWVQLKKNKGVL